MHEVGMQCNNADLCLAQLCCMNCRASRLVQQYRRISHGLNSGAGGYLLQSASKLGLRPPPVVYPSWQPGVETPCSRIDEHGCHGCSNNVAYSPHATAVAQHDLHATLQPVARRLTVGRTPHPC